jgi:hypothetical protein
MVARGVRREGRRGQPPRLILAVLALLIAPNGCRTDSERPKAVAVLNFGELSSAKPSQVRATLAFIAENSVALLLCAGPIWGPPCALAVGKLTAGGLQFSARTRVPNVASAVFGTSNSAILLTSPRGVQYVYTVDLGNAQEYTIHNLQEPLVRSDIVGEDAGEWRIAGYDRWNAFRITPALTQVGSGEGALLSLSDRYVVIREGDEIFTRTMDGHLLGSFRINQPGLRATVIALGPNRLYISNEGERIADFSGRELLRLRPPVGWGYRHGWSADGRRMLYDHYLKTAATLREFVKGFLPIPQNANGEEIRVVDTATGDICFEWNSPGQLLGLAGDYHADLSPSGRLVAAVNGTSLSIYQLPEVCASR